MTHHFRRRSVRGRLFSLDLAAAIFWIFGTHRWFQSGYFPAPSRELLAEGCVSISPACRRCPICRGDFLARIFAPVLYQ